MKVQRQTMTAIKTVDKPKLHRLRELVYTSLPMISRSTCFGEPVFEKTHQLLKRAIIISNNRDIQFQCMRSVAYNDWEGRLKLFAGHVLDGSSNALRSCFRLLL